MYNKRKIGSEGESKAIDYLKSKCYEIIETNFYSRYGEIDIIAKNKDIIVFIEVKYRKNNKYGLGSESISAKKIISISKTANLYLNSREVNCRFDVISIDNNNVTHIENAFEYQIS